MAGGLPGSRAFIPSCPLGTAMPSTITEPGGATTASRLATSLEGGGELSPSPETFPSDRAETRVQVQPKVGREERSGV